jgi:hypothetical protein
MNDPRNPSAPLPAEPPFERGAAGGVLDALESAQRKATRYGAYDIVVVMLCGDRIEMVNTAGNAPDLAHALRRVADRLNPVDEHGIGEQTRKHLTIALRDALKALEGT